MGPMRVPRANWRALAPVRQQLGTHRTRRRLSIQHEKRRDEMPLFLLPYLYSQLVMASVSSFWTIPVTTREE